MKSWQIPIIMELGLGENQPGRDSRACVPGLHRHPHPVTTCVPISACGLVKPSSPCGREKSQVRGSGLVIESKSCIEQRYWRNTYLWHQHFHTQFNVKKLINMMISVFLFAFEDIWGICENLIKQTCKNYDQDCTAVFLLFKAFNSFQGTWDTRLVKVHGLHLPSMFKCLGKSKIVKSSACYF